MKLVSCMQINIKVYYKLSIVSYKVSHKLGIKVSYKVIQSLLMGMIKYSQSTQSNKFAMSLQYLKKEVANGHQSFYKLA